MEFFRVWFTGVMNLFGNFERENQRLVDAKVSSSKLKAIKNLSLPPADEDGAIHKSVMDKTREITNIYPTVSRRDITHNRLEALSARLEERLT